MKDLKLHALMIYLSLLCNISMAYIYDQKKDLPEESVIINQSELLKLSIEQEKDQEYLDMATKEELLQLKKINPEKEYTLIVFMAASNDLHKFALKNITQMEAIGSNERINVIVQLNLPGNSIPTKRYLIQQGKRLLIEPDNKPITEKLNSGDPQTLIDCVEWTMTHFPAKNLILNFWNHGSGCWDPGVSKTINTCDLFLVNETTNTLELDRSIEYIKHIEEQNNHEEVCNSSPHVYNQEDKRGICFDDTYKSYMTNQDVKKALYEIHHRILKGKKIAAVWFDACLMSMIEITNLCKDHADFFIGSQDVEWAAGSNYHLVLYPFTKTSMSPKEFACHVVNSFQKAYQNITKDFTQSALDLSLVQHIEDNVNLVAQQLLAALQLQKNKSVINMIQKCKSRLLCTCFEEPSFIDLRHFYLNLQTNLKDIQLTQPLEEIATKSRLNSLIEQGINSINNAVIANTSGSNLAHACGLSIYFPEKIIFNSYARCNFALSNCWSKLLTHYLAQTKREINEEI